MFVLDFNRPTLESYSLTPPGLTLIQSVQLNFPTGICTNLVSWNYLILSPSANELFLVYQYCPYQNSFRAFLERWTYDSSTGQLTRQEQLPPLGLWARSFFSIASRNMLLSLILYGNDFSDWMTWTIDGNSGVAPLNSVSSDLPESAPQAGAATRRPNAVAITSSGRFLVAGYGESWLSTNDLHSFELLDDGTAPEISAASTNQELPYEVAIAESQGVAFVATEVYSNGLISQVNLHWYSFNPQTGSLGSQLGQINAGETIHISVAGNFLVMAGCTTVRTYSISATGLTQVDMKPITRSSAAIVTQ